MAAEKTVWVVSIYDRTTDALIAEHFAVGVDGAAVQRLWGLGSNEAPRPLPVTSDSLDYINDHLATPIVLRPDEEVYLEQYQE